MKKTTKTAKATTKKAESIQTCEACGKRYRNQHACPKAVAHVATDADFQRAALRAQKASRTRKANAAEKATKPTKKAVKTPKAAKPARETKGATVIALISRVGGATAAELQQATGWQAHSLRGFLSVANSKGLAKVASARRDDGARVYSVA